MASISGIGDSRSKVRTAALAAAVVIVAATAAVAQEGCLDIAEDVVPTTLLETGPNTLEGVTTIDFSGPIDGQQGPFAVDMTTTLVDGLPAVHDFHFPALGSSFGATSTYFERFRNGNCLLHVTLTFTITGTLMAWVGLPVFWTPIAYYWV